jgi:Leucine-rich repeat (LRR) protein
MKFIFSGTLLLLCNLTFTQGRFYSYEEASEYPTEVKELILNYNKNGDNAEGYNYSQFPNLEVLYVNKRNLKFFPNSVLDCSKMKTLSLIGNNITELPSDISKLKNLEFLDLAGNNLQEIPESIGELGKLETLSIDENQLIKLPSAIGRLSKLEYLAVDQNELTSLPEGLSLLKKLEYLYINENSLKALPDLSKMTKMLEFDCSMNNLIELPNGITKWKNCYFLDASNCQLTKLPNEIGNMKSMGWLYLDSNAISRLPQSIGELADLIDFGLVTNNLKELPESIGKLKNLQRLDVGFNLLESVPRMNQNISLKFVILEHNNLSEINLDGFYYDSLKTIDLSYNPLIKVSGNIANYTRLELIDISYTKFALPESWKSPVLEKLFLAGNDLSELKMDLKNNFPELELLDLSHNLFTDIPEKLRKCDSLKVLNISNNQIDVPSWHNIPLNIEDLNLSNNKLKEMSRELYQFDLLSVLNLGHNQISSMSIFEEENGRKKYIYQVYLDSIPNLHSIDISYNPYNSWPAYMFSNHIGIYKMAGIGLKEVPDFSKSTYYGIPGTIELDLSNNEISSWNALFNNVMNSLNLSNNKLTEVVLDEFLVMMTSRLYLANNQINKIVLLESLKDSAWEILDISGNPIPIENVNELRKIIEGSCFVIFDQK